MKGKWVYVLALIFGVLTTFFVYSFLSSVEKNITTDLTEEVVVLARDVAPKTVLTREMLVTQSIPINYIHPQSIRKTGEALGTITLTPLVEGEQLLKNKITIPGKAKDGLAYLIPEGKRAISIPVDEVSGVAGLLKPGDRVDIASIMSVSDSMGKETLASLIVLQNIPILAVGKNMSEKPSKSETESSGKKTITLAVTLEDAQALLLAGQKGVLRLLLRSPIDDSIVWTIPFEVQDLVK